MFRSDAQDITGLLAAWQAGDGDALSELMPLVYQRLKEIASHLVRRESGNPTLGTTALVHEAYLRLVPLERIGWQDRAHFFSMCARIMRRTLVDRARYHHREKRSVRPSRGETADLWSLPSEPEPSVVILDDALRELAMRDAQAASIVEMRFFGGLDREAIAEVLGISSATVTRRWRSARAWLITYMQEEIS